MRRNIILILAAICACVVEAQETQPLKTDSVAGMLPSRCVDGTVQRYVHEPYGYDMGSDMTLPVFNDSLNLPVLNRYGRMNIGRYPMDMCGMYDWELHKGLNVNIGASVFAMFGKNVPHGAGFGQSLSAMYAVPLTDKLSFAAGGYINNVYWAHSSYRDAGLNAVLGYKFDEHWEAYLYGQKSIMNRHMPLPLYDMNNLGDRIGAAVRYNFNPSFSIQVSVSAGERDFPAFIPVHAEPKR